MEGCKDVCYIFVAPETFAVTAAGNNVSYLSGPKSGFVSLRLTSA